MAHGKQPDDITVVIKPRSGWEFIDFRELGAYRDLLFFLVWRDIKVIYAQTILGFAWAVLNPLAQIIIFGVVFGHVANVSSDGIPYILFSSVAIIPWTYMSEAMQNSSQSLVAGQGMLDKIYFPRLLFPLTGVLSKLVDFVVSLIILLGLLVYYRVSPTVNLLLLPFFVIYMMLIPAGIGMWLSALAVRFRDVKFALQFIIRMLIYTAPIVYSASAIPARYRLLYSVNPVVGVVEGFRACLLGAAMPWPYILPGLLFALLLVISGAFYFRRMEESFADVI